MDTGGTWRDRLAAWNLILQKERLAEELGSVNSKYEVEFDMKEVEASLRKDVLEKANNARGTRALWISKRWWRYRPKLPYTYFLQKLDSSEVKIILLSLYKLTCTVLRLWLLVVESIAFLDIIVIFMYDSHCIISTQNFFWLLILSAGLHIILS